MNIWVRIYGLMDGGDADFRSELTVQANVAINIYRTREQAYTAMREFGGVALETTTESLGDLRRQYGIAGDGISASSTDDEGGNDPGIPQKYLHMDIIVPSYSLTYEDEDDQAGSVDFSSEDGEFCQTVSSEIGEQGILV
jgi:hypothetical protein